MDKSMNITIQRLWIYLRGKKRGFRSKDITTFTEAYLIYMCLKSFVLYHTSVLKVIFQNREKNACLILSDLMSDQDYYIILDFKIVCGHNLSQNLIDSLFGPKRRDQLKKNSCIWLQFIK